MSQEIKMNLQVLHQVKIFSMILQLIWVKVFFMHYAIFPIINFLYVQTWYFTNEPEFSMSLFIFKDFYFV